MNNKIPIPTDNIFKFYALFSLLLFVFAVGSSLYMNQTSNEQLVSLIVEIETLKQDKVPSSSQKLRQIVLERQFEVAKSNKNFYRWALAILAGIGVVGMSYGFNKWHKEVQPLADETARVQLEIGKLQLAKLKKEAESSDA